MNKLKLSIIASILASGIASASSSCENFKVFLKNNLHDKLLVDTIKLKNGTIEPNIIELDEQSRQTFTIHQLNTDEIMEGEFVLRTISLPSKKVTIYYTLDPKVGVCEHTDKSPPGEISLEKSRKFGGVQYTIK